MKAYDDAVARGDKYPCRSVQNLKLPGFYRCCVFKWKKDRSEQCWTTLCQVAPKLAKRHHELPDFLREIIGKGRKFSTRRPVGESDTSTCTMPEPLVMVIAETVVPWKPAF